MKEFYLIKKFNKIIPITNIDEIVTRMREYDWNNKSTNKDYMHVYAFWRQQNSNVYIRYENEKEFVEDLFRFKQIVRVNFWNYITMNLFGFKHYNYQHHPTFS